uniref:Uncharacterized protein n=1 Tax=Panagrolaimus sp. PS1159 TaxID=55785 RepID=A0AC35FW07_9BILA
MIQSPSNLDNPNNRGAMTAPGTPLTNRAHRNPLQSQPINDQRTSKSNRSITLSVNKKFPTGGSSRQKIGSYNTSGEGTHAFADGSGYNKAAGATATTASRWHDSFDETGDGDDPILPIDANAAIPRSPMNNRFPRTILSPQQPTTQAESSAIASSSPSSNNLNNNNNAKNEGYISPRLMRRSISASKSAAPLASADSGLGGSPITNGSHNSASSTIMSHFKNLVNSFNIGSGSGHSRRRSLSRGISLDDHRSITNAQQKPSTTSSTHATPSIYRRSEEPKDRQTLEDEERELRRQRRLRRRSDCQQMLPEKQQLQQQQQNQDRYHYKYDHGSTSPVPSRRTIIPSVQKTVIVNNDGAYRVESRLMNNGVVVESTPPPLEDKKSSQSCRRKRYQFLNFAPRAMSKS